MTEWNKTTLGEVVELGGGFIRTGPFGSQLHASDYVEEGIPCIMPTNLKDNRISLNEIARISPEDAERLSRYIVKEGDIVYSRRGDVTLKALVRKQDSGYFCGTGCLLVRPGDSVDSGFIVYYLSTSSSKNWILKQVVGATMPNLNTKILARYPLQLPSLRDQQKIASTLEALNSKIELNNRINAELEAMAKTIYDYWFVQFDFPISAAYAASVGKPEMEGRPYKSSGGEMVWNGEIKREVPKGWEVKPLSAVVACNKHTRKKGDTYNFINYLDTSSLTENKVASLQRIDPNTEKVPSRAQRVVQQNDILYSTVRPNQLHFGIIKDPVENMIASTGFAQLSSKKEGVSNDLVYFFLSSEHITARLQKIAENSVSAYPSISPNDILNLRVALPKDTSILASINSFLDTTLTSISKRQIENQELASLRDWLLPMLMNGQVKVGEALKEYVQDGEVGMAAEKRGSYRTSKRRT